MGSVGNYLPLIGMILVQLGLAGLNVLSKLTMASGMSPYVLITYRNLLGAVFLAPFAFFFERYDLIFSSINISDFLMAIYVTH